MGLRLDIKKRKTVEGCQVKKDAIAPVSKGQKASNGHGENMKILEEAEETDRRDGGNGTTRLSTPYKNVPGAAG